MYATNKKALIQDTKTDRTKGKRDESTVMVGEFKTPLSVTEISRQNISKDTET